MAYRAQWAGIRGWPTCPGIHRQRDRCGAPDASAEVQTAAAGKALVVLAQTEWSAAAHGMAALFLAGQNRLVAADLLAGGNVVRLRERRP
jgi:hypothetical protein